MMDDRAREIDQQIKLLNTSNNVPILWLAVERLGKIGASNPQAIKALVNILSTSENYSLILEKAAESLGKIDPDNPQAIEALVNILSTSENDSILSQAAESLKNIDPGNPKVIEGLVKILSISKNDLMLWQAAESLEKIGAGNPQAIKGLVKILSTSNDDSILMQAAESLGKIGASNPQAIEGLIKILSSGNNDSILIQAAKSLEKIDPGNPQVIEALVNILSTDKIWTQNIILRQAADYLGKIACGNPQAIKALVKILPSSKYDYKYDYKYDSILIQAVESLGKIGVGNPQAIEGLVKIFSSTKDDSIWIQAAESLEKIDPGNPRVIKGLVKILSSTKDDSIWIQVAKSLEKIDPGYPKAIKALVKILSTSKNDSILLRAAESLKKIDPDNPKVIEALSKICCISQNDSILWQAVEILEEIEPENPQFIEIQIAILRAKKDQLIRRDIKRFEKIGRDKPNVVIRALREVWRTTNSPYTRLIVEETLNKIDPSVNQKAPKLENELDLFLQVTRVKDTVDQYFAVNQHIKTKFCYHRIIASLERMQAGRDILTRRSLMKDYVEIYQRIVTYYLQKKEYCRAFFYMEVLRNRYLVERIAQQNNPLPETLTTQLKESIQQAQIEERRTLQEYTNGIASNIEEQQLEQLGDRWDNTKEELEKLYTEVDKTEPEFIAKTKVHPIHFSEVRDSLPAHTAILEFFFTKRELVIMLILPGAEAPIVPESPTTTIRLKALSQLARDWNNDITEPKTTSKKETKKESKKNIEATITAISEKIDLLSELLKSNKLLEYIPEQIKHLIIVSHQYLHLLPLHTLWLNETERLIDRFAVSYVPNLRVWQICQQRQREQNSLVCIENPSQDKKLLIVKAEVAALNQCQQFSQKQILTEGTSKTEIYQIAKNNHGFHFSGHAEYNLENPLQSYLMLSSENLTLKDIFSDLQMPQTDLVTLSACDTAVVDAFQPTEEYLGLPTGFLLAGAKAVIGSLWKVNSISTAFLFDEFYRQLELTNNKAIALQKAQNWLRNCSADELRTRSKSWYATHLEETDKLILEWTLDKLKGKPFQSPYYWAAFILTGG